MKLINSCNAVLSAKIFVTVTLAFAIVFVIQTGLVSNHGQWVSKLFIKNIYFKGYVNESKGKLSHFYSMKVKNTRPKSIWQ